jgi:predicted site-specific integrase-resolvase
MTETHAPETLLAEGQASDVLAVSISTLRRWRSNGEGPVYVKMKGSVRYRIADIRAFVMDSRRDCRPIEP